MREFIHGASLAIEGILIFYKDRSLWKFTVFPWLLLFAVYTGVIWLIFKLSGRLSLYLTSRMANFPEFLQTLLQGTLTVTAILLAAIIVFTTLSTLFEIFGGLFFDNLIAAFEEKYYKTQLPEVSLVHQIGYAFQGAWFCTKSALLFLLCLAAGFFIPVAGQILLVLVMGMRTAYSLLLAPGFLRDRSVRETRLLFRGRRMEVAGFGTAVYLLQLLPLMLPFTLPGMILGAVILYNNAAPQNNTSDRS